MTNTNNPNYKYILLAEKLEEEGDFLTAERNYLLSVIKNSELIENTDDNDENKIYYINDSTNYRAKLGSFYLRNENYDKAEPFLLDAVRLKEKLIGIIKNSDIERELASMYYDLAELYYNKENIENAIKYNNLSLSIYNKLIERYNEIDDKDKLSSIFISLAIISKKNSNISSAEKNFLQAINIKEDIVDECEDNEYKNRLAISYIGLANLYLSNGKGKNAERYLFMAIDVLNKIDNLEENYVYGSTLATCYLNLSCLYEDIDLFDKYLNNAIEVKFMLLKRFKYEKDAIDIINFYENLANVYKSNGKHIKALSYNKKAKSFKKMIS